MTEIEEYIKTYFSGTHEELKLIGSLFNPYVLKKGEYFLRAGNHSDKLGFVKSGIIREYTNIENKEITKWIASTGYFTVDISSFIFHHPARWNLQAVSDCELFVLNKKDYEQIKKQISNWDELEKKFIVKCFSVLEDRIIMHLSMSAEERYLKFFNASKELFNLVPLQYIASMLSMTPETLSRLRNKNATNS